MSTLDGVNDQWKVGPLLTLEESMQAAERRIYTDLKNPWNATIEFIYPERSLHINVRRGRRDIKDLAAKLVYAPWPRFAPEIKATDQHVEIYEPRWKSGFIVRFVRRGIPWKSTRSRYDLAELYFRVPRKPPELWVMDKSMQKEVESNHPMTPTMLMEFVGHAKKASVCATGAFAEFEAIRKGRSFMKLGSMQLLTG